MSEEKNAAIRRMQIVRKIVLFGLIVCLVIIAALSRTPVQDTALHEGLETIGLILIGLAIIGRGWCSLYIGGRKKAEIVDQGPYSVTRNPLYVFSILGALGIGAQTGSLSLSLVFAGVAFVVFWATTKGEEAWLLDAFGPAYADYIGRTPRFWPNFSLWRATETLEVRPRFFLTTLVDGMALLLAVPIFELVEHAQEAGWIPTFMVLP